MFVCAGVIPNLQKEHRKIIVRLGIAGTNCQSPLVTTPSFSSITANLVGVAERMVGGGIVLSLLNRITKVLNCPSQLALRREQKPEIIVSFGVIGAKAQRLTIVRGGFLFVSQTTKNNTEIVMRLGIIRPTL